ncbi:hypothetical protein XF35_30010 [Streptomyces platensis subsp. clarensis]|nr:hypothetical protein [Streptomyces platensis subsp. clarensis]
MPPAFHRNGKSARCFPAAAPAAPVGACRWPLPWWRPPTPRDRARQTVGPAVGGRRHTPLARTAVNSAHHTRNWLTAHTSACSTEPMRPQQRLVTRDHIDFGRVWSASCCR